VTRKETTAELIKFLLANPKPADAEMHAWAKERSLDVHEVEAVCYELAAKFIKLMNEGRAREKGITARDVDPTELKAGIEVELEHTSDREIAKKIALDHLAESKEWEDPKYYAGLDAMEGKLKKGEPIK